LLELEHLPGLEHCLDPIAHLVIASIDVPLYRRWTGGHPLDVWRPQVKPHVEFAPVPRFDSPAQQLYVLLRHRLLLQPHGFEGLCAIRISDHTKSLLLPERPDV